MKVDPHAALLAAQNLRTGQTTARGREASANFFAELKKASGPAMQATTIKAATTSHNQAVNNEPSAQIATQNHLREAPLRQANSAGPLPPGSLLNIVV